MFVRQLSKKKKIAGKLLELHCSLSTFSSLQISSLSCCLTLLFSLTLWDILWVLGGSMPFVSGDDTFSLRILDALCVLKMLLGRIELCKPYNVPCQIMSQQGRMYSTIYGFLWTLEKNLPSEGLVVECGNVPCLLARTSMTFNPCYQFKRNRGPFAIHFAKCGQWFDKWRRLWIIWAQILF